LIETDARRHVIKAIELEKEIMSFEAREKLKGKVVLNCPEYNDLRKKLIEKCCHINAVANEIGKGRDDLTVNILLDAESVSRKVSETQSRAVRKLADDIKKSFTSIRMLLRKYGESIDAVDPQLKNNPELVDVLVPFEKTWEKGKEFFSDGKTCNQLIHFSQLIESVSEKYSDVQEKITTMDTEIFVIIPCLVVLNSLDGDDKGICEKYYTSLEEGGPEHEYYQSMKAKYLSLKKRSKDGYELYNILEQTIIDKPLNIAGLKKCYITKEEVDSLVHNIKRVAMGLQRYHPSDWNSLLETAMGLTT